MYSEETRAGNGLGDLAKNLAKLGDVKAPATILPAVLKQVGLADAYWTFEAAVGRFFVAYNERGISAVMRAGEPAEFEADFVERFGRVAAGPARPPKALAEAVEAALAGERPKNLHFDLRGLSQFEQEVLRKTLEIPRGEIRPYAWVAAEIGHAPAVRAVGSALGHNPIPLLIPCHRVVRSDGRIGNYIFGSDAKWSLLAAEGAQPEQLEQWARAGVRYYGSDTTHIFCYPTCRHARRITDAHRVAFRSGEQALAAGYRPCRTCRPALAV